MPRAPSIRIPLKLPFMEALRELTFAYVEGGRLRLDEVGMKVSAFEDYIRKWENVTRKQAAGVIFRSYDPQGKDQGYIASPDEIIDRHRRGCRVVMIGIGEDKNQEIRWSG